MQTMMDIPVIDQIANLGKVEWWLLDLTSWKDCKHGSRWTRDTDGAAALDSSSKNATRDKLASKELYCTAFVLNRHSNIDRGLAATIGRIADTAIVLHEHEQQWTHSDENNEDHTDCQDGLVEPTQTTQKDCFHPPEGGHPLKGGGKAIEMQKRHETKVRDVDESESAEITRARVTQSNLLKAGRAGRHRCKDFGDITFW